MPSDKPVRIAVDIGGTFTDLQIHDARTGLIHALKTPSTPSDPSIGLITGIKKAASRFGFEAGDISRIVHGSTIATNAVLERKLPKGALITTKGFEDVLEIGRHMRKDVYALKAEPRALLIPRERRFGVSERTRANGEIETELDGEELRRLARKLVSLDVRAAAIVFLHGYRNPQNERQALEIFSEEAPEITVCLSSDVSPEIREYERCSTTVMNALLMPVMSNYLETLTGRLEETDITAPLYLVQSNGGVVSPEDAARLPAKLLLSGPAGGAMALSELAAAQELENVVGIDMGGTSSDVSVVIGGSTGETSESEIDGLPVRLPMIEIRTIGAGGGSLARAPGGAMRVGPESAGAEPGPVCYGRGGKQPTVTDANAALGRIDPEACLGGEMALDVASARAAIGGRIGRSLNLKQELAAEGIVAVANTHMAGAVRLSLFEKGADPSDFALVPFGGAAGLHACEIAGELGISRIIFPEDASTLSARGILNADLRWDFSKSGLLVAGEDNLPAISAVIAGVYDEASEKLASEGIPGEARRIEIACDLRYRGQAFELSVPWPEYAIGAEVNAEQLGMLCTRFHEIHAQRFSHSSPEDAVELVTARAVAIGMMDKAVASDALPDVDEEPPGSRALYLGGEWLNVPVHRRSNLFRAGFALEGPALVSEDYTMLYIAPGWTVTAASGGGLMARKTETPS
ncbi:MAG: hydantoinase/oxoprolinase family protein [Pseudomonadota bacterium]